MICLSSNFPTEHDKQKIGFIWVEQVPEGFVSEVSPLTMETVSSEVMMISMEFKHRHAKRARVIFLCQELK